MRLLRFRDYVIQSFSQINQIIFVAFRKDRHTEKNLWKNQRSISNSRWGNIMPLIALLKDQQILFKSLYGFLLFKDNKALYPKKQLRNYDRLCYRVALILITD